MASGAHFLSEKTISSIDKKPFGIWASIQTRNEEEPSDSTNLHNYISHLLATYRITKPVLIFIRQLWRYYDNRNWEMRTRLFDETTFFELFLEDKEYDEIVYFTFLQKHATEMYALASGCTVSRGPRGESYAILDAFGNFTNEFKEIAELLVNDAYLSFNISNDYWKELSNATKLEDILLNCGVLWADYSVLWDAVKDDEIQNMVNVKQGTLKVNVTHELMSMGLGVLTFEDKELRTGRGRPPKIFNPTQWGEKLVKLCDQLGYNFPDAVRSLTRKQQSRPTPEKRKVYQLRAAYTKLGLTSPENIEELSAQGVTPAHVRQSFARKEYKELLQKAAIQEAINKKKEQEMRELAATDITKLVEPKEVIEPKMIAPDPTVEATANLMVQFRELSKMAKEVGINPETIFGVKQKLAASEYSFTDLSEAVAELARLIQIASQPQEQSEFEEEDIADAPTGEYYDVGVEKWGPPASFLEELSE